MNQLITVVGRNMTLGELMTMIEQQTDYRFAYNKSTFDLSSRVTISMTNAKVEDILDAALKSTSFSYVTNQNHIIIIPLRERLPEAPETQQPVLADLPDRSTSHTVPSERPTTDLSPQTTEPVQSLSIDDIYMESVDNSLYMVIPNMPPIRLRDLERIQLVDLQLPKPERDIRKVPLLGIKTNLVYDASSTFNLGVEVGFGKRWSVDLSANYNPWTFSENKKISHILVQPEVRYWMNESFSGHFFGMHLHWAHYNVGNLGMFGSEMKHSRYQGDLYGAGFSYGYHLYLAPRWSMEFTAGLGYAYMDYKRYECNTCGRYLEHVTKNYFGPTKLGISMIFMIK